jgi:hypothetical protein
VYCSGRSFFLTTVIVQALHLSSLFRFHFILRFGIVSCTFFICLNRKLTYLFTVSSSNKRICILRRCVLFKPDNSRVSGCQELEPSFFPLEKSTNWKEYSIRKFQCAASPNIWFQVCNTNHCHSHPQRESKTTYV